MKRGGACNQKTLFEILIRAASNGDSIENTTKIFKKSPSGGDLRYHLDKIHNFEQLESQINLALKHKIPQRIKNSSHKMTRDLNLIPYYGKPDEDEISISMRQNLVLVRSMLMQPYVY